MFLNKWEYVLFEHVVSSQQNGPKETTKPVVMTVGRWKVGSQTRNHESQLNVFALHDATYLTPT